MKAEVVSQKLYSLQKRTAKLEQQAVERARREKLADCICRELTGAFSVEKFEAEMNRECPVHGFRRLGRIIAVTYVNKDSTFADESTKLDRLVEAYNLRLAQVVKSRRDLEDDSEEP